jgi:hypothetical protein
LLHQVGDLFELNVKLRCQNVNMVSIIYQALHETRLSMRYEAKFLNTERHILILIACNVIDVILVSYSGITKFEYDRGLTDLTEALLSSNFGLSSYFRPKTRIEKSVQGERKMHGNTIFVTSCRPCRHVVEQVKLIH